METESYNSLSQTILLPLFAQRYIFGQRYNQNSPMEITVLLTSLLPGTNKFPRPLSWADTPSPPPLNHSHIQTPTPNSPGHFCRETHIGQTKKSTPFLCYKIMLLLMVHNCFWIRHLIELFKCQQQPTLHVNKRFVPLPNILSIFNNKSKLE